MLALVVVVVFYDRSWTFGKTIKVFFVLPFGMYTFIMCFKTDMSE